MSKKGLACLTIALLAAFIISGCGTTPKKVQAEVTGIKARVETLESRVESVETKQAEVERTAAEQAQALEDLKASSAPQAKSNISVKSRDDTRGSRMKDIQQALKKAGYYDGKIDGVKGKGTKKAIKDFQKANGLMADGMVGSRTWDLLSRYLSGADESVAAAAAVAAVPAPVSGDEGIK